MAFCGKCGNELKDGTKFCPKCGHPTGVNPVNSSPNPNINDRKCNLTIRWEGAWVLIDATVRVIVNGAYIGEYSFKDGFEAIVPIDSEFVTVKIKCSFREYTQYLSLSTKTNYSLNISYSRISGGFGFSLCDNDGYEIYNDSLHLGMAILSFLIPIVGFIYALIVRKDKPAASTNAIIMSVAGFVVALILYLR